MKEQKLEMKYFVIKMNQPINILELLIQLETFSQTPRRKIILGKELAKLLLKSMIF